MPNDKALQVWREAVLHSLKPCHQQVVFFTDCKARLVGDVIHRSTETVEKHGIAAACARKAEKSEGQIG